MKPCHSKPCKDCANWVMDIDDHIVGWCKRHNEWRGQFEGIDVSGECKWFEVRPVFVEAAQVKRKRRKVKQGANKQVIEANREQLLMWHAEGKSCWWMGQMIGIQERSRSIVSKWFIVNGIRRKAAKNV